MTPEQVVKRAICDWLSYQKNCLFWVNSSTGIYDPRTKKFRKNNGKYQRNGTSDILGIWYSRFMAIECKSKNGTLTSDQIKFINDVRANGGIAFVARSIEDCVKNLLHQKSLPNLSPSPQSKSD